MVRCTASLRSVLDLVTKARVSRPPRNIKLQIRCSKDWNQVVSKIGGSKTPRPDFKRRITDDFCYVVAQAQPYERKRKMEIMEGREPIKAEVHWPLAGMSLVKSGAESCHGFLRLRHCVATHSTSG